MLDYDEDFTLLMNCVKDDMENKYHQTIEDNIARQDAAMTKRYPQETPVPPRSVYNLARDISEKLDIDPEWLFLEEAIFSQEDRQPALVDVFKPKNWWDEEEVNVLTPPTPLTEDRVDHYLKQSSTT